MARKIISSDAQISTNRSGSAAAPSRTISSSLSRTSRCHWLVGSVVLVGHPSVIRRSSVDRPSLSLWLLRIAIIAQTCASYGCPTVLYLSLPATGFALSTLLCSYRTPHACDSDQSKSKTHRQHGALSDILLVNMHGLPPSIVRRRYSAELLYVNPREERLLFRQGGDRQ